jgi:hypothetical protein
MLYRFHIIYLVLVTAVFTVGCDEPPAVSYSDLRMFVTENFARADFINQRTGVIQPWDQSDTSKAMVWFEGRDGEWVSARITSQEFDTYLALFAVDSLEYREIAYGEFERSLSVQTLAAQLPADGLYVWFVTDFGQKKAGAHFVLQTSKSKQPPPFDPNLRWIRLDENSLSTTFVDRYTVKNLGNGRREVWTNLVFRLPEQSPVGQIDRRTMKAQIDCLSNRIRAEYLAEYLGDRLLLENRNASEWGEIVPNSIGETLTFYVCN